MPLLTLILIAPAAAGLANLLLVPRRVMPWLNVLAFGATLGFGDCAPSRGAGARRRHRME